MTMAYDYDDSNPQAAMDQLFQDLEAAREKKRVRARDVTGEPWQDKNGEWHFPPTEKMAYRLRPHHFDETGTARDASGRQILLKATGDGYWEGDDFFYFGVPYKDLPSNIKLRELRHPASKANRDSNGVAMRGRPKLGAEELKRRYGDPMEETFGNEFWLLSGWIAKLRMDRGMGQAEFAREVGIPLARMSQAETGVAGLGEESIRRIIKELKLPPDIGLRLIVADAVRRKYLPRLDVFGIEGGGLSKGAYHLTVAYVVYGMLELCELNQEAGADLLMLKEGVLGFLEAAREAKRRQDNSKQGGGK